jgi:hypothetical protein
MLTHDLVDRPTQDVDLFTPDPVTRLTDALAVALRAEGAQVRVLGVTVADGRAVVVKIAHDARIREIGAAVVRQGASSRRGGRRQDSSALFGRAAARDLVDVAALSERYPLERLCELAAEKDPGFDRRVFADALSAAAAHSDAAFTELGLEPETVAGHRASAAQWRTELLNAADMSAADAGQSFGGRTPPGSKAPGSPSSPRPSEPHRSPPNAGRRPIAVPLSSRKAEVLAGGFADRWRLLGLARYFRLSRPDTSWYTTCSQTGEGSRERLRNLRNVMRTSRPSQSGQGQVR